MAAKITTEMIKPFTGDGDVVAWIKKVELVAKLQKVTDLASFLPLFLEGDALALFLQMEASDQADPEKIKDKLLNAFSDGPHVAYAKMVQKRWCGEQIDVYANEITRLAGLAGFTGDALSKIVKLNFVYGLPTAVSIELQQVQDLLALPISSIIERARILTSTVRKDCVATARNLPDSSCQVNDGKNVSFNCRFRAFKGKCFECEGPHMAKYCPEKKRIICYICRKQGHTSTVCPDNVKRSQGNE